MSDKPLPKSSPVRPEHPAGASRGSTLDMERIYIEIRASLLRYASRYFKRSHEAEDVVQEAFVKVIEAQHKRGIQSPKSYLFRTARNIALAHIGKSSYKLTDEMGDILTESDLLVSKTLEDQFEVRENFEMFCRAVRTLPTKCRRVFVLCRVYGYSQKEVAAHMGVTLSTVEGHLTRAMVRCNDFMEAEQSSPVAGEASRFSAKENRNG